MQSLVTSTHSVCSLFSGIGGIEVGLRKKGFGSEFFCEIDPAARAIISAKFPGSTLVKDVKSIMKLPQADLMAAGFPCQDLSMAGTKRGITGNRSGLVTHLFELLRATKPRPDILVIENVPYMLALAKGEAMRLIVSEVESLGYKWAYRIVDPRGLGIPQRRPRVVFLAARSFHPRDVLFSRDTTDAGFGDALSSALQEDSDYGFYWTEGLRGIGWAKDAVPPIKGGSSIGIPSPPALWHVRTGMFGTISLEDAERLQGFPTGWTKPAEAIGERPSVRWRLVGNAVCTKVSEWLAEQIKKPAPFDRSLVVGQLSDRWPSAAFGDGGRVFRVNSSPYPQYARTKTKIGEFLIRPTKPLSHKAASGFLSRAKASPSIVYPKDFLFALEKYIKSACPK
jgi:DNA (cytosine-5)-methyltransferase 1